jgi:hypothetical protein
MGSRAIHCVRSAHPDRPYVLDRGRMGFEALRKRTFKTQRKLVRQAMQPVSSSKRQKHLLDSAKKIAGVDVKYSPHVFSG